MLGSKQRMLLPAAALAVALSGCAHTKVVNAWRDPGHERFPKKVLVHAMAMSPTVKDLFENMMVERLKARGVDALAGHNVLPDRMALDKAAMRKVVSEQGIDGILVGHPVDSKVVETFGSLRWQEVATVYFDPEGDFVMAAFGTTLAPEIHSSEKGTAEFIVFDVAAKKRVWVLQTETYVWENKTREVQPLVDLVLERLRADRMIP